MARRSLNNFIKTSEILENKIMPLNQVLIINDDSVCNTSEKIAKVTKYIIDNSKMYNRIMIESCYPELYLYLLKVAKSNNIKNISVTFVQNQFPINYLYKITDSFIPVEFAYEDKKENIFEIDFSDLKKINFDDKRLDMHDKLSFEEIIKAFDYIAKQIDYYAENDLQKVLLLDKMFREYTDYDREYYNNRENYNLLGFHKAHKLETIFTDRLVVCNVYSIFAELLFNHPLLRSVEIREVNGDCCDDGHAWNEIKINGLWYTHDFTHNVWFDKVNGVDYTLMKKTNPRLVKSDGSSFDYLNTMPRQIVLNEYEKIKDIHIKFPTIEQIKSGNLGLCTRRSLNTLGITRRRVIPINANNTFNNEQIITRRRVPKRRKAIVGNK